MMAILWASRPSPQNWLLRPSRRSAQNGNRSRSFRTRNYSTIFARARDKETIPRATATGLSRAKWTTAFASADHRLQQTYTVSYIAHVPLEPRAALAKWDGDHLTVWTGTQRPFGVRGQLAEAFHIAEDQVRVLMPDTGSAYGGKHTEKLRLKRRDWRGPRSVQ